MLIFYEQNSLYAFKQIFIDQFDFAVREYFWAYSSFCRLKYTIFKKNYEKHRGERRRQGGE